MKTNERHFQTLFYGDLNETVFKTWFSPLQFIADGRYSMKSESEVNALISQSTSAVGAGTLCGLCGKVLRHSGSVRRHFLDKHVTLGIIGYYCPACRRTYKSKNSMQVHISTNHRDWSGHFDYEKYKVNAAPSQEAWMNM